MKLNRLSKISIIFGLILIVGIISYFVVPNNLRDENEISQSKKEKILEYYDCAFVLTEYKSYLSNISLDELKEQGVYTYSSVDSFAGIDQLSDQMVISGSDVITAYDLTQKDKPVIVKFADIDSKMRMVSVDGFFPFDKESIDNYPLCTLKQKSLEEDEYEEERKKYYQFGEKLYDFDIESVKSIYVAGEIVPARAVDRIWLNQSDNYTLLFDRYSQIIKTSDLALAMIENPLNGNPEPCRGCMIFVGDERNVEGMKSIGFDAMGVGNHFGDGGKNGLTRTIDLYKQYDMKLAGASYTSLDEAKAPTILEMGDKKVAFLSAEEVAAYYWFGQEYGVNFYSNKSASGGVGNINYEKIKNDIEHAKEISDFVIVMMSWGTEYTNSSNNHQKALAHALIDAGADLIVGSHPHWVQEIEVYNDKFIFYSLGNFIFDQTGEGVNEHWSRKKGETRQGISVQFYYYDDKIINTKIIPHKICGYEQFGGESYNKTKNLAWKIQNGEMSYSEVDAMPEKEGCVWYQPTPVNQDSETYRLIWDRLMQHSKIN